ncbi:MAG TPA: hypothetical protein VFT55_07135 [Planctomycetota bacterium]|nr:hypothetical protein [Planctomycetota bacterium]
MARFLRACLARLHSLCGWIGYRFGFRAAARRHYERVLVLRGCDFPAYVHLGRIAFDVGDYAGWRREFEHARRADPRRFERLRHRLDLFEPRLAGTDFDRQGTFATFDDTGARATWRSLRPFGSNGGHRANSARPDLPIEPGLDALLPGCDARAETSFDSRNVGSPGGGSASESCDAPADAEDAHDDCRSAAERRRFRALGPIAASDLKRLDFDDLLRRLSS